MARRYPRHADIRELYRRFRRIDGRRNQSHSLAANLQARRCGRSCDSCIPSAEIPVKLGNTAVQYRVVDAVWGFFSVYVIVFGIMMVAMLMTGLDQVTAFSAVAATLNNLGPGLGDVASGFMTVPDTAKWIAVVGMLLGRLEIFTLLVLITPTFWRH